MEIGKVLILVGIVIFVVGILLTFVGKLPFQLGKLPGDIVYKKEGLTVYFPLTTSVILSLILSILFYLFEKIFR